MQKLKQMFSSLELCKCVHKYMCPLSNILAQFNLKMLQKDFIKSFRTMLNPTVDIIFENL